MEADPLQQLRALHVPTEPGWWPPAPGWWLLLALVALLLLWVGWALLDLRRQLRPVAIARHEHATFKAQLAAGELTPAAYLNNTNALLKRLALFALNRPDLAASSGRDWLTALDQLVGSDAFSAGPGQALDADRFRRVPAPISPALAGLVEQALDQAQGLLRRSWGKRWLRAFKALRPRVPHRLRSWLANRRHRAVS